MTASHILVLGTSAIDTKGRAAGPIIPSTANPGDICVTVNSMQRYFPDDS